MLEKRFFKVYPCIRILTICIILHREAKTLVAGSNSCEVTRSTVQVVDGCPVSEESWRERAAVKKCAAYASQCAEPERLVYHCVINPYVNQTLEVCAYPQNIVNGKCTSYSSSGNVIQENWGADCSKFIENACPTVYRSNVTYKYPGCYKLIKNLTTVKYNPMLTRNPDTTFVSTTPSSNMSTNKHVEMSGTEEKMDSNKVTIMAITLPVIFVVFIVSIVFVVLKKKRKKPRRSQSFDKIPKPEVGHRLLNAEENEN